MELLLIVTAQFITKRDGTVTNCGSSVYSGGSREGPPLFLDQRPVPPPHSAYPKVWIRHWFITKCNGIITNCESLVYYKVPWNYYKLPQLSLLQSATELLQIVTA